MTATPLPTIDDVAVAAGVSRQTVSNVLNAPDIVREATRQKVRDAIDALGYRPHASARRPRTQTSSTIGIRMGALSRGGVSGAVLDRFLHALTERADSRGMRIMLFTAADEAAEIEQYRRLRDGADVDALVVTGTAYGDARLDWLADNGVPFVAFGRPWGSADLDDPRRPWVDVDGADGVRQATVHLAGRGLRRIGYLGWPDGSGTGDDRRSGWVAAMRELFGDAGADGTTDADLESLTIRAEEGVAPARVELERLLAGGTDLEALVCASDSLALGAMMAVREAGHPKFPVIGFDNTPVAGAVGLSSVDQQLDQVALAVLDLLMGEHGRRVLNPDEIDGARHRLVTPKLIVRRSSHLAPVDEAGSTASGTNE
ncbi:LacI family DNA-binding transcriptional regulator [Schumannella luteola]|uniref:DNA-binding LacI/PurR family transcriptional regulator n=1 Tax=Schumannella luteola TaxID=472059 RepID=A0A852YF09_9MICO|nr:LacI family DNA-binding transcriptional regulator [Schumannella luteola]NYG98297.1 DNA-binding LacI/PurR family transcriptional regulator [Schumannella luteola]TPX05731.1 LacI family transcriptional regulator [Schumannella luteola]